MMVPSFVSLGLPGLSYFHFPRCSCCPRSVDLGFAYLLSVVVTSSRSLSFMVVYMARKEKMSGTVVGGSEEGLVEKWDCFPSVDGGGVDCFLAAFGCDVVRYSVVIGVPQEELPFIRKLAIVTAGQAFTHLIKVYHEENLQLVTNGIYRFVRRPDYCGFFIWFVGSQIMLCNPISTIAFTVVVWKFFSGRIPCEDNQELMGTSWGVEGYRYIRSNNDFPYGVGIINSLASYLTKELSFVLSSYPSPAVQPLPPPFLLLSPPLDRIIRTDLSTPVERLKALVPCWRIAGLLPLLADKCFHYGSNFPCTDFERTDLGNGRKWLGIKETYDFLDHSAEFVVKASEKDLALQNEAY
ncbi:hypothetical protein H5410_016616 [Solanum commersonii]|uniref:Protein-S-isoprenylcysteine O-methyltransferase n=1 Tax=Solanum commersonii TaxID=4109 RepID=A0A9J5ZX32_SOLCO|nr:hypothetical protein H5410_016616 [Solanum commersonii]